MRRTPRFCSTSSMSCAIWPGPWLKFAGGIPAACGVATGATPGAGIPPAGAPGGTQAPTAGGLGCSSQERIRAACGSRPALHQGPEIHLAVAQGEPHARRQEGIEDIAFGQQAAQHGLCPQGELWPVMELRTRGLGAALLREL